MRPSLYNAGRALQRSGGRPFGLALLLLLASAGAVCAQLASVDTTPKGPAGECCAEMRYPLGGRIIALGQAVVADTSADMVTINPAGLAGLHHAELLVHYRPVPSGRVVGISYITRPYRFGTFGINYILMDQDTMPVDIGQGQSEVVGSMYEQAHTLSAAFATSLGSGFTGGVAYKIFVLVAPGADKGYTGGGSSALTQMIDAGVQYHPPRYRWLALGAAVNNAGLPLQVVNFEQADRTPTRTRAGATVEYLHFLQRDTTVSGTVSVQYQMGGDLGSFTAVGTQLTLGNVISLRAGWIFGGDPLVVGPDQTGGSLGIGIALQRFTLDVARTLTSEPLEPNPFHITFRMSF